MKWTQEVLKLVEEYHYLGSKRSLLFCFHMNLSSRMRKIIVADLKMKNCTFVKIRVFAVFSLI